MNKTDLSEYFELLRKGDKQAFAEIFSELKVPVYTIICRIVQSQHLAEDVTQDVFVKLFVSPPEPSVKNPRAWIFRMARNSAIDALRKKQSSDIDGCSPAADDEISGMIARWDMESAIGRLPQDEREILSLHINAELGFGEIANIVGLSLPAVYRRYRKALRSLREFLTEV